MNDIREAAYTGGNFCIYTLFPYFTYGFDFKKIMDMSEYFKHTLPVLK
jgi:hypothetical protein